MHTVTFPAITADTVLAGINTLAEAKAVARDMRHTAIVVANAHGDTSDIARAVSARYWDFVDAMAVKFA